MRPCSLISNSFMRPLLAIICMSALTCGAYAQQGVSGSLTAGTGSPAYLELRGAPANPQIDCALNSGTNCSILFAPKGSGGFNFQNGNGGNSVQILGTNLSPGDALQYVPNSAGPAVFTASVGAVFIGTGSGTGLMATLVTGVIHPGNALTASITGSGVPNFTYIVSQVSGAPGGAGVYATNNFITSSGASITLASTTMDVTGMTSGTIAMGQSDSGMGIASGTALTALIGSGTGGVGNYTISPAQYSPSTTVTALGSTVTLATSNSALITLNPGLALTGAVAFNNNGIGVATQQKLQSTFNVTGIDSDIGQQGAGIFNINANLENSTNFASAPPAMSVTTQQLGTGYARGLVGLQVFANLTSTPTNVPITWAATTAYGNGSMMYDANADLFQTFTGGTTGSIAPTLMICNPSCTDGTVTWKYTGSYLFGLAGTVASQVYGGINANQGGSAAATMGTGWGLLGGINVGANGTYTQAATAQELDINVTPTGTAAPGSLVGLGIYTQAAGQGRFADTAISIAGTPGNYRKNAIQFGTTLDPNAGVGLSVYDSRGYAQYGAGLIDCSQCGNFGGTQSQFGNDTPFIMKSPNFNLLATGDMRIGYGLIHVASNGFSLDVPNFAVTSNSGFSGGTGWINSEEACDTLGNCGTITQSGGVPSGITVYTSTYIPGNAVPGTTPVAWHAVSVSSPGATGGSTEGTPFTTVESYAQASSPTIGIGGVSATAVNLGNSGSTTTVAGAFRTTGLTTLAASGTALNVTNNATVGGSLVVGFPIGGSQGPGTLNVPSLFVNGVSVTGVGSATPGGSASNIQFYGAGGFAGDSTLTFNASSKQLGASSLLLPGLGTALNVTNNATVGGMLGVNGVATFSGGLTGTLTGGASLNLPLAGGTVTGATTFSAPGTALAVPNNATVGGTLGVNGAATFSGGLTGTLTGGASLSLPLAGGNVTGATTFSASGTALAVPSNATVGGTLGVNGTATFSGGLTGTLTGGASLNLPLAGGTVTGATTFAGGLTGAVTGHASLDLPLSGGTIAGATTFSSGLTGSLTGAASLDLPLTGGTVTGALSVTNNATVGGVTTVGTTGNPLTITPGATSGAGAVITNTGTGGIGINPSGTLIVGGNETVTGVLQSPKQIALGAGTVNLVNGTGYTPGYYSTGTYQGNYNQNGGIFPLNFNAVDNVADTGSGGFNLLSLNVSTSSTTMQGGIGALFANTTINGNQSSNGGVAVGGTFNVTVNAPFGTGSAFGLNPVVGVTTNAGFSQSIVGQETDIGVGLGNTVNNKIGMTVVSLQSDKMHGTGDDAGLGMSAQVGGVGFNTGISFGGAYGHWPLNSTSTIIGAKVPGGDATPTAAFGVDLSAVAFSNAAFKSTGFLVSPIGAVTTPGIDNSTTLVIGPTSATSISIGNVGSTTTIAGALAVGVTTLPIAATTYTPDGSNSDYAITLSSVCVSAACTLANPSKMQVAGATGIIFVTQPSSGGPASFGTWGSNYQAPGGTSSIILSTTANAVDILRYVVKDSTHILIVPSLNFSH